VAFDNPALELLMRFRNELFQGIPIVFGGINDFNPIMLLGHQGITGVAEIMDDEKTLEMVLKFDPNTKEVLGACCVTLYLFSELRYTTIS